MIQSLSRRIVTSSLSTVVLLIASLSGSQSVVPPAGSSAASSTGNLTLTVYTCCGSLAGFDDSNPADLTSMHAIFAARWAQAFPQLRWHEVAFADQTAMESTLAAKVKAGSTPDMVFVQGDIMGRLVLRGLAQPLDRYMAVAHMSPASFLHGMVRWAHFGGHWWAIPAVSGPLGGQEIYLPTYMSALGYDNRTLRTFEDYYQMSRKAVRFDASGHLTRIGFWPGIDSWETTGTLMCSPGHGLYDTTNQPTATDPCNVAYLTYLKKLADLYGGYATLKDFLAGDPDFLNGNPKSYLATGKALIVPSGGAYWNISPLDSNTFGVKGGISYQLTTLPPTLHGTQAEVATYPSTMQEVIIPPGARHPDTAFAVSDMMFWSDGALLGRSLSGSPLTSNQTQWLSQVIAGEASLRRQSGLHGNPIARLAGVQMQPQLGEISRAANPINPVAPYYYQRLIAATEQVLYGTVSPRQALATVQQQVLAEEQHLKATYGTWSW